MNAQNIENEVKYKIKDIEKIKAKILAEGFIFHSEKYQEDYYFSPFHKNFAGTRKYYLRLRKKNDSCIFAYHIVKNDLQTKEFEVGVDNFEVFYKILGLLDFKKDCVVKKNRLTYQKDGIEIMVDNVKNLGNFIEIEWCGKFTKDVKNRFHSLIETFGLKEQDLVSGLGYPDLLMAKNHD